MQDKQTPSGRTRRHGVRAMLAAAAVAAVLGLAALAGNAQPPPRQMPDFGSSDPGRWLNSEPLSRQDFRGDVVLIEIWTSV